MEEVKSYETLDTFTKQWLVEVVSEDKYGLTPRTLFNNIYNSYGVDDRQLAQLFEVPVGLVRAIKK